MLGVSISLNGISIELSRRSFIMDFIFSEDPRLYCVFQEFSRIKDEQLKKNICL